MKVVHTEGAAALVQWVERGKLKRTIVPLPVVDDGNVPADELEAGLPYGEDWTKASGVSAALADELRRQGLWTKADLLRSAHLVRDAVLRTYVPPVVKALIEFSRED